LNSLFHFSYTSILSLVSKGKAAGDEVVGCGSWPAGTGSSMNSCIPVVQLFEGKDVLKPVSWTLCLKVNKRVPWFMRSGVISTTAKPTEPQAKNGATINFSSRLPCGSHSRCLQSNSLKLVVQNRKDFGWLSAYPYNDWPRQQHRTKDHPREYLCSTAQGHYDST
jgi:hypothetical protein